MLTEQLKQLKNQGNKIVYIKGDLFKKVTDNDLMQFKQAGFITKLKQSKGIFTMTIYLDNEYYQETLQSA